MSVRNPIIIVGGGLSGLTAAVRLTSADVPVLLLEQKPYLGGRARSFPDPESGDVVDNGQHLLIAGYRRTRELLRTIGGHEDLYIQKRPLLLFHHPTRGFGRVMLHLLPAPLHFLWGIMRFTILPIGDRLNILKAGLHLRSLGETGLERAAAMTIAEWLDERRQSAESRRCFWEPLATAIMNEKTTAASAGPFLRALAAAFLTDPAGSALAFPRVGLSQLFADRAQEYIAAHHGHVRCGTDVESVRLDGGLAAGVRLKDGTTIAGDAVILAVPWYRSGALMQGLAGDEFADSPIVSIHLWFNEECMPHESVGLIGRRVQWLFNRRMINREKGRGAHLSAVISAAREYSAMSNDELVALVLEDLRSVYPGASTHPTHSMVIREKRATFSVTPDAERKRPGQQTSVPNLFLAGDWTKTGLPATIEGAVMSAERCVELVQKWLRSPDPGGN